MKTAIFSDIHGNLEALKAVLADAKSKGCTEFTCLGDIVGYGANPNECIEAVQELNGTVIKGNHDEACANNHSLHDFSWLAALAAEWTRDKLSQKNKQWLNDLKLSFVNSIYTAVHASIDQPAFWKYTLGKLAASFCIDHQHTPICFYGHTHYPMAFIQNGKKIKVGLFTKMKILADQKYLVNVGSVGQPRDHNPKASYVILDSEKNFFELQRVAYDVKKAQGKILACGLVERAAGRLAERLGQGE